MKKNDKLLSKLTGLPDDVVIFDHDKRGDDVIEIYVSWYEPMGEDRICPECGSTWCVKKDSGKSQTLRHTPSGLFNIWLTFHKPRFVCRDCGRSFYMRPWWAQTHMTITIHLFYLIYKLLVTTTMNLTEIARRTNSTPSIVRNVMNRIHLAKPMSLPRSLGIDEFHGSTGHYDTSSKSYVVEKYHCVIVDTEKSTIIDVVKNPSYKTLHNYFMQYHYSVRKNVQFVSMDMRSGFSKVTHECFPHARICIDPFHIVKLLTEAVSTVRIDEWRRLHDLYQKYCDETKGLDDPDKSISKHRELLKKNYTTIKNSQKLLIASPYNGDTHWGSHPMERDDRLETVFTLAPALKMPFDALMEFYDVSNSTSFDVQHKMLAEWISKWESCDCPPVKQTAFSISKRRSGIECAWKYKKSNSPTEGLNKKIKDIKRAGFGMHDFETFRKRILLGLGYDHFIEETYTIHKKRLESTSQTTKGGDTV